MLKVNHVFLVPSIILALPSATLFQQGILLIPILSIIGLGGMLTRNRAASSFASMSLLGLIVWGKVASDLFDLARIDSAVLLLEFMIVILLMEASNTAILFDSGMREILNKRDDASMEARLQLSKWVSDSLLGLGRLILGAFGLSLALVVVGDLLSFSFNQLAISGILVLAAVVALVILLTYNREPEDLRK